MSKRSKESGFSAVEIGMVVVAIAIVGTVGWKFYDTAYNKETVSNVSQRENLDLQTSDLDAIVDLETIQQAAVADKDDTTVEHVELELGKDGSLLYKAQLSNGTVAVYDARTGDLVKVVTDQEKTSEALPATFTGGIGFARALEIAKAEKPESKVFKIELELEGGIVVYSVRFGDKARVDVNAEDGSIVRTKASKASRKAAKAEEKTVKNEQKAAEKQTKAAEKAEKTEKAAAKSTKDVDDRTEKDSGKSSSDDSKLDDDDNLSGSDDDDDEDDKDDDDEDDSTDNSGSGSN